MLKIQKYPQYFGICKENIFVCDKNWAISSLLCYLEPSASQESYNPVNNAGPRPARFPLIYDLQIASCHSIEGLRDIYEAEAPVLVKVRIDCCINI